MKKSLQFVSDWLRIIPTQIRNAKSSLTTKNANDLNKLETRLDRFKQ